MPANRVSTKNILITPELLNGFANSSVMYSGLILRSGAIVSNVSLDNVAWPFSNWESEGWAIPALWAMSACLTPCVSRANLNIWPKGFFIMNPLYLIHRLMST